MKDNLTYDTALARIEEIVTHLEDENKSIDELSSLVKEASELVQYCKQRLKMTEEDILKAFGEE
ncbi:MAG TPA: exodeoxyribonuclease VII small subunit [Anditalea sp.]|nr:exodeoxyribonuclease VII small subunit [Anditalea sp.]